jgi:hypothetical protein
MNDNVTKAEEQFHLIMAAGEIFNDDMVLERNAKIQNIGFNH